MSASGPFQAEFTYKADDLQDFEKLYRSKKQLSLPIRIFFGLAGALGALFFGYNLYTKGFNLAWTGYLVACSLMLVLAFHKENKNQPDKTCQRYRKYYTGKKVNFLINEDGIEMHLEKQQNYSKSPYKKIHGLFKTDRCWYIAIQTQAYYVIEKKALTGGSAKEFEQYLEKKCQKRFIAYEV